MPLDSQPPLRIAAQPKAPPWSCEAEQSTLGGMMLDNRAIPDVLERVSADDFYRQDHRLIFTTISRLAGARRPADFITVTEALRQLGKLEEAGGIAYLGSLVNDTPSVVNLLAYADIVRERAQLRRLIVAAGDIAEMGYNPDGRPLAELIDSAESQVLAVRGRSEAGRSAARSSAQLMPLVESLIERRQCGETPPGLPTGLTDFDQVTGGLQPSTLTLIAGRPSSGKTSVALNIAEHVALYEKKAVAVFSMEMPGEDLQLRILSSFARIDLMNLRMGHPLQDRDYDRLVSQGSLLREAPIYVDDTASLSPAELRARARRLKRDHDIQLLVLDYIQLMKVPGLKASERTQEVAEISRSLKLLAMELAIPVLALSQLNRGAETRANKRPMMADLRESGALEQDADLIAFIYRDEVYNHDSRDKGLAEIIIAKHRNGPLKTIKTAFMGQYVRFENLAAGYMNV